MPKPTLNCNGQDKIRMINRVYSKLEPLRDIDADIRTVAITICKWFGAKTYDVIILKINLALIGVAGDGGRGVFFNI